MRISRSTLRSALAAVTVAVAMTAGAATAFADQQDDRNGDKNATRCDEDGVELAGQKLVNNGDVLVEGFAFSYEDGVINEDTSVTITSVDQNFTVTGVVVKGGPGFNVYEVGNDLDAAPEGMPWQGLRAPDNPGGNTPTLSHWFVCGYPDDEDTTTQPTTHTTTSSPTDTETSAPTTEPDRSTTTTPGGSETTTPGESTTPSPSSSQPAAPTVTSTTEAVPAVSSDDTENLAYTGFNNAWLVWLGGALVLAGAAALVLLRVRRSRG